MELKTIKLPSGVEIQVQPAPFAKAKALYQAVLEEMKGMKITASDELDTNFVKDLFCGFLSSKKIEDCVWECMASALYKGVRIDKNTFEPVQAREDYIHACYEVAKENILPFGKSLYAEYGHLLGAITKDLT